MSWFEILKKARKLHPIVIEEIERKLQQRGKIPTSTLVDIGRYAIQDYNNNPERKGHKLRPQNYPTAHEINAWAEEHMKIMDTMEPHKTWMWMGAR
tara:strand:+ start:245 stop:532 length:288 start_codon:yes stop_codon:yes gene_type:complete